MKTSFTKSQSKTIERVVVFLRLPSQSVPREDEERFERALEHFEQFQRRLNTQIDALQQLWDRPLLRVSVIWEKRLSHERDLNAHILGAPKGIRPVVLGGTARALVSLLQLHDGPAPAGAELLQSHLVAVIIDGKTEDINWRKAIGVTSAIVEASIDNYLWALEDILLDVVIFNSWPPIVASLTTAAQKQEFSRRKVAFIDSRVSDLPVHLNDIRDVQYVSFATVCRTNERLDLPSYVQIWRDFLSSFGAGDPPQPPPTPAAPTLMRRSEVRVTETSQKGVGSASKEAVRLAVDYILAKHRKAGQISRRRLSKLIRTLPPGNYLLLRAESKPRLKQLQSAVNGVFSAGRWRTGRLHVVPAADQPRFQVYRRYISMFRFVLDMTGEFDLTRSKESPMTREARKS